MHACQRAELDTTALGGGDDATAERIKMKDTIQYKVDLRPRLEALRARLQREGIDGILISHPDNRRYLSGFTGSSGWLLVTAEQAQLATDSRYFEQVIRQCAGIELIRIGRHLTEVLPGMLAQAHVRRLAFEADIVTVDAAREWTGATPGCEWVPVTGWVLEQRATKDAFELATLRSTIRLADDALADALVQARPGMTERDLAWLIEQCLHDSGADQLAFSVVVACGPNGAMPHAVPTGEPLVPGQPIVIDMGARVDGYCSDMTRTVCLGEPNDPQKFWQVFNTVLRAQQAAVAALRPGAAGDAIDLVARKVITDAGYGDFFGHGLGHGVGLSVGELPRLSRAYSDILPAGSLVTIEPGIYLPGWGGVRIEDIALITEEGAEILTSMHKAPIIPLR